MFTGIVEEKGKVLELSASGRLKVEASLVLEDTRIGDSIAVSGVCLTVVQLHPGAFTVDVMPETLRTSTLGRRRPGSPVNLERAMGAGGRFSGHIVNGHIDGIGRIRRATREENAVVLEIGVPVEISRYMAPKGSVAVDGISLTLVDAAPDGFTVSVIPHTLEQTTLENAGQGDEVNIEVDIIAKYVEAFLSRREGRPGIEEALARGGFLEPGQEI